MSRLLDFYRMRGKGYLSAAARNIFHYLSEHDVRGNCYPSVERMMMDMEYAKTTIKDGIKELIEQGLVEKRHNHLTSRGMGCSYILHYFDLNHRIEVRKRRATRDGQGVPVTRDGLSAPSEGGGLGAENVRGRGAQTAPYFNGMILNIGEGERYAHAHAKDLFERMRAGDRELAGEITDRLRSWDGTAIAELTANGISGRKLEGVKLITSADDVSIWQTAMDFIEEVVNEGIEVSDPAALLEKRIMDKVGKSRTKLVDDYVMAMKMAM